MRYKKIILVFLLLLLTSLICMFIFAQGVGYIQIICEPGAAVFLDNNFVGNTSSELGGLILQVPSGSHEVKIVKEGFEPQSVKIDLKANEIYVYEVKLLSEIIVIQSGEAQMDLIKPNVKELQKNKESEEEKSSNITLDLERVSTSDVLYLRNGDVITGTILNKNYNITTSYAKLQISNKMIQEIYLESGVNNISKIITINNNKISGYIDNPVIVFRLKNGNEIEVRREKILKLFFEVSKQDLEAISQNQFIILKNGDYFSGTILEEEVYLATTYAEIHLSLNDTRSITQIRGENPLTKIEMLNGDLIQGILKTENIEVILDVGSRIKIYQDQIDIIYCQKGYIPYKKLEFLDKNLIFDESSSNRNRYVKTNIGLEILELANDSPLLDLGIETGDILINIDGKQIDSLQILDLVFKELLLGNRGKAIMEVIRGKENLFFNLIDLIK